MIMHYAFELNIGLPEILKNMASRFSFYSFPGYEFLISTI